MAGSILALPFLCENVNYILHTLALESPLPNIVVAPIKLDINIPAIDVNSGPARKSCHRIIISLQSFLMQ